MNKRVSILIEEEVIRHAKRLAVKEGRPLSDVIQRDLVFYLSKKMAHPRTQEEVYQLFCKRRMGIRIKQFKEIMRDEPRNQ
jgi:hypothetical protein